MADSPHLNQNPPGHSPARRRESSASFSQRPSASIDTPLHPKNEPEDEPPPPPNHTPNSYTSIAPIRGPSPRETNKMSVSALTGPSTPVGAGTSGATFAQLLSLSGTKSRKSSCDLCHHRKIKCDQVRPACGSCQRKGHTCNYSEETERHMPVASSARLQKSTISKAQTVTIISPALDGQRVTLPIPPPRNQQNLLNLSRGGGPEWTSNRSDSFGSASGSGVKKEKDRRRRIMDGFDSESEEEKKGESGESGEVDELLSDNDADKDSEGSGKKEGTNDDVSGELLELASGPPKRKKARPSISTAPAANLIKLKSAATPKTRQSLPSSLPSQTTSSASPQQPFDNYSSPIQMLMTSLPSTDMQNILFTTFFSDPFLTEGISLLQPQYIDDFKWMKERRGKRLGLGDATTLANTFAILAIALRILPKETSDLLLAAAPTGGISTWQGVHQPRSLARTIASMPATVIDTTPLEQRYFDLALLSAQIAEQNDSPNIMMVMHKLILYRYCNIRHDRIVLEGGYLAQAIKIAQALGLGKEWDQIPQADRELRRRLMWALYIADRHHAFETALPYTIMEAHQGIHLPSPISEADLYAIPQDKQSLPPHSTENGPTACTALFIHTHLARRLTPILDSFATATPVGTPHELVLRFDSSLDTFQDALPAYLRLLPRTDTRFDSAHPYLPAHRLRLHSTFLSFRTGVLRAHLLRYLTPEAVAGCRQVIANTALTFIRVQRSARMLDPKVAPRVFSSQIVFENAATLALIMHVEKLLFNGDESRVDYIAMRNGVTEAAELLDAAGAASEAIWSRRAVNVLRELIVRIDAPLPALMLNQNTHGPDKHSSPSQTSDHPPSPPATADPSPHVSRLNNWIDSFRVFNLCTEFLLRDPQWEGSWEKVALGM